MSIKMTAAQVPAHLGESITMTTVQLEKIISGTSPTSIILTRSNTKILKKVLMTRSEGNFVYGQFIIMKIEQEDEDEWEYIQMNELIKSPRYWCENDFIELHK